MTEKRESTGARRDAAAEIIDLGRGAGDFAADVRTGLSSTPKTLSPRYFYDDLGSVLFDAICRIPEYYVARSEHEILRDRASEIVASMPSPLRLVDLGSGTAAKSRRLIDAILGRQPKLEFLPIDIDPVTLRATADSLTADYAAVRVTAFAGSFQDGLRALSSREVPTADHTLVLFLGSTLGNLEPSSQLEILQATRAVLLPGDALLVGTDLVKDERVLIPAYDDVLGVTAAFNRNVLVRINRELGGTFDVAAFRHEARYDPALRRIEMHLVSTARQRVAIAAAGIEIDFAEGESIHTESSYKFTPATVERLAQESGFRLERHWTDGAGWFGENLLTAD